MGKYEKRMQLQKKIFFAFILYNFTKNMVVEIIISFFPIVIASY